MFRKSGGDHRRIISNQPMLTGWQIGIFWPVAWFPQPEISLSFNHFIRQSGQ
jgi:hypothetical protein